MLVLQFNFEVSKIFYNLQKNFKFLFWVFGCFSFIFNQNLVKQLLIYKNFWIFFKKALNKFKFLQLTQGFKVVLKIKGFNYNIVLKKKFLILKLNYKQLLIFTLVKRVLFFIKSKLKHLVCFSFSWFSLCRFVNFLRSFKSNYKKIHKGVYYIQSNFLNFF